MVIKLSIILSLITILTLNVILLIAASSNGQALVNNNWFSLIVNIMYFALIGSSLLLAYINWRKSQLAWAFIFVNNVFIVLISTILSMSGLINLPSTFLIFLDLYWLNKYLVYMLSSFTLLKSPLRLVANH